MPQGFIIKKRKRRYILENNKKILTANKINKLADPEIPKKAQS